MTQPITDEQMAEIVARLEAEKARADRAAAENKIIWERLETARRANEGLSTDLALALHKISALEFTIAEPNLPLPLPGHVGHNREAEALAEIDRDLLPAKATP